MRGGADPSGLGGPRLLEAQVTVRLRTRIAGSRTTRRGASRRGWAYSALLLCLPLLVLGFIAPPAQAADGTILRTITAENYSCSVGTGLAFDGEQILLSCDYDNIITAVDPADGSFIRTYQIDGIS